MIDNSPLLARTTTSGCGGQLRDKDDMSEHVIAVSQQFYPTLVSFSAYHHLNRPQRGSRCQKQLFRRVLGATFPYDPCCWMHFLCIPGGGSSGEAERRVMP
jgi:hypothetical protein